MKITPRLLVTGLLAVAALISLPSCATNVNTVERAQPLATPDYVADKRVVTDNTLARTIRANAVNQATVSGDLQKIQVTLENLKNNPRTIRYKFEWFDKAGMAISSPNETWKTLMLQGRETVAVSTVAVSPSAVDFLLKITE